MGMEWSSFAMLLIVVALASACQNLTGFAFALIFVGLAGALHLLPIADAANVAGLLSLVNGVVYLRSHPFKPRWDLLKPMLIMIRPQMKRQKEHRAMIDALAKGDEVVTSGGLLGKVARLGEGFVHLEVAEGVEVQIQRSAVAQVLPKGTLK